MLANMSSILSPNNWGIKEKDISVVKKLKDLRIPVPVDELPRVHELAIELGYKSTADWVRQLMIADAGGRLALEVEDRGWRSDLHPELKPRNPAA